jgi:hypothetical protein
MPLHPLDLLSANAAKSNPDWSSSKAKLERFFE